jgi:dTDP-glucose 4,6-dehydratase
VRDWLHVSDHAAALLHVLEAGVPGRTYNIGGSNEMANIDLVRRVCAHLDALRPREAGGRYEELISFVTDRPGHDKRYAIDGTRIREELGWSPSAEPERALLETVRWYLDNREWWERILRGEYRLERLGLQTASGAEEGRS